METAVRSLDELMLDRETPSRAEGIAANHAVPQQDISLEEEVMQRNKDKMVAYLTENVAEFRRLSELRRKGWASTAADQFFANQRRQADEGDRDTVIALNKMMGRIAREMHSLTRAFTIRTRGAGHPMVLDMCAAPGTYLSFALQTNPGAGAVGFSLPPEQGGHKLVLETSETVRIKFLDVTMLAADMGVPISDIPPDHPHAKDFRPAEFHPGLTFDLVLCDGQVLRTHKDHRAEYRERREARRLTLTQLALGLEHLRPGGTMIVLLHRFEAWDTVLLLHTFTRFSTVKTFKPRFDHAKKSSFYMVATDVQSTKAEAVAAVEGWKEDWKAATFETDDERWRQIRPEIRANVPDVDEFLDEFGPELVRMGKKIWTIQADALERAPFMRRR
ncbi:hypothetical protein VP1G_00842 [Cytospora mali]|uniref:Ribosomal RNA methyltransferase FtsJ domain-containing protein n=1 Tax=Cytospora mali TaxID=578113 RepID=A0A194UPG3_CYTMA|nr:hypothetical protein VP1G_00842 [Valsa mali var. pyri (nom. inval.)]